jgi:hypothetical protein
MGHRTPQRHEHPDHNLCHARFRSIDGFLCEYYRYTAYHNALITSAAVSSPAMERSLCCSQEAERSSDRSPRTSGQLLWLDTATMEGHRGTGVGFGRSGCLRGMNSSEVCDVVNFGLNAPLSTWLSSRWPSSSLVLLCSSPWLSLSQFMTNTQTKM